MTTVTQSFAKIGVDKGARVLVQVGSSNDQMMNKKEVVQYHSGSLWLLYSKPHSLQTNTLSAQVGSDFTQVTQTPWLPPRNVKRPLKGTFIQRHLQGSASKPQRISDWRKAIPGLHDKELHILCCSLAV
jgi:hypothetical protein